MNTTVSHRRSSRGAVRLGLTALVCGNVLLFAACASVPPPTEQVAATTEAVAHAGGAGAGELAPLEMQLARDKLNRANLAMAAEDFDRARALAQESQADAQLAEAKAQSAKARKAADELREAGRVLSKEIDRKTQ